MRPCGYAEAPQQVETAEEEPCDRAEYKRIDVKTIAEGADVVEWGKDERADDGRHDPGDQWSKAEDFLRGPGEQSDEQHPKEQLFIDSSANGNHEQGPATHVLHSQTNRHRGRRSAE